MNPVLLYVSVHFTHFSFCEQLNTHSQNVNIRSHVDTCSTFHMKRTLDTYINDWFSCFNVYKNGITVACDCASYNHTLGSFLKRFYATECAKLFYLCKISICYAFFSRPVFSPCKPFLTQFLSLGKKGRRQSILSFLCSSVCSPFLISQSNRLVWGWVGGGKRREEKHLKRHSTNRKQKHKINQLKCP